MTHLELFALSLSWALDSRRDVLEECLEMVALEREGQMRLPDSLGGVGDGESVEPRLGQVIHTGSVRDATR